MYLVSIYNCLFWESKCSYFWSFLEMNCLRFFVFLHRCLSLFYLLFLLLFCSLIFFSKMTQSQVLSLWNIAGLIISLQLLRGDMEQVRRENPLIFSRGVAITRKLGFPDVIMPGESHPHITMCSRNTSTHTGFVLFLVWTQHNKHHHQRKSGNILRENIQKLCSKKVFFQ